MAWMKKCRVDEFDPFSDTPEEVVGYHFDLHIVSGGAPKGADNLAEEFARQKGLSATIHYAKWIDNNGDKDLTAGFERNAKIVNDCEVILAFWDLTSHGTSDTINKAVMWGKPVWVVKPDGTVLDGAEALRESRRRPA